LGRDLTTCEKNLQKNAAGSPEFTSSRKRLQEGIQPFSTSERIEGSVQAPQSRSLVRQKLEAADGFACVDRALLAFEQLPRREEEYL
jgi:hypothetical protein